MSKKYFIYIAPVILILVVLFIIALKPKNNEDINKVDKVREAFSVVETPFLEGEIYAWSNYSNIFSKSEEDDIWNNILKATSCNEKSCIESYTKEGFSRKENEGISDEFYISNIFEQVSKSKQVMSISIKSKNLDALSAILSDVEKIYSAKSLIPEINVSIKGSKGGKLSVQEIKGLQNNVFGKLKAQVVESYEENGSNVNVTGFTKELGNTIKIGGRSVNINFSIRYNREENRSYICLASPVIRTEY